MQAVCMPTSLRSPGSVAVVVFVLAAGGCSIAGCATRSARPTIATGTGNAAQAGVVAGDAECTATGRWEISMQSAGGCPLPDDVVVVGGIGKSMSSSTGVPAMLWKLTSEKASDGRCRHALEGVAGRFFTVRGELQVQGNSFSGPGQATPGMTAYSCGGPVEFSGRREP